MNSMKLNRCPTETQKKDEAITRNCFLLISLIYHTEGVEKQSSVKLNPKPYVAFLTVNAVFLFRISISFIGQV